MSKYTLTSGEVAELCGIAANTVKNYVENGLIAPARGVVTNGRDGGRLFSAPQAIAMVYCQQYRAMGCDGKAVLNMMTAISQLSLNQIEELIEKGRTVCFPLVQNYESDEERYECKPQWLAPSLAEGSPHYTKSDRMMWEALNIAHAHAKVMVRLGQRYPELTRNQETAPKTEEDKTVEFLKNARQVAANLVNNKKKTQRLRGK